jgi:membrane protein required for colicin V production
MDFTWIDWLIVGIIALSTIISLIRGFTREVLSLATWIISVWLAIRYTPAFDVWIGDRITSPELRMATAFLAIFLAVLIFGTIVSFLISKIINGTGLSGTDRLLGSIFGVARGALIVVLMIVAGGLTPVIDSPAWKNSLMLPAFDPLTQKLLEYIPKDATIAWINKEKKEENKTEGQAANAPLESLSSVPSSSLAPIPAAPVTATTPATPPAAPVEPVQNQTAPITEPVQTAPVTTQ